MSKQQNSSASPQAMHNTSLESTSSSWTEIRLYEPLQEGEVRIFALIPDAPKAPLEGFFVTVKLSEAAEKLRDWHALSYTWGDQSCPIRMTIHGKQNTQHEVLIGPNLASALTRLRPTPGPNTYFLWVDALCINQKDDSERNKQVQIMPQIYESAKNVMVWLGEEFDGVEESFAWLRDLIQSATVATSGTDLMQNYTNLNALLSTEIASTLERLLGLPYWRRAWIIQEVTVSKDPYVICGSHWATFSSFSALAGIIQSLVTSRRIKQKDCPYSQLMPVAQDLLMLTEFRNGWRPCYGGVNFMELEALVRRTYSRVLASDPRDRFYALLGISTSPDWLALRPDYTVSRDDLYIKATTYLIRKTSSLGILQLGENLNHLSTDPSWLPGWDQGQCGSSPRYALKSPDHDSVTASFITVDKLHILRLSGRAVGKLVLCNPFQPEEDKFQPSSCIMHWLDILSNVGTSLPNPYEKSYGRLEAFTRSLVTGNQMLAPSPELLLRNVFSIWSTMTDSETNIPEGWRLLQAERSRATAFDPQLSPAATYRRHALEALHRRSFVITENGYIGVAPDGSLEGDLAVLIEGYGVPICLRPQNDNFRWIGAMYLHDVTPVSQRHLSLTMFEIH